MKSPFISFALGVLILALPLITSEPNFPAASAAAQFAAATTTQTTRVAAPLAHSVSNSSATQTNAKTSHPPTQTTSPLAAALVSAPTAAASASINDADSAAKGAPIASGPASGTALSAIELAVIADINAARAANGLSALAPDSALAHIARAHSADMLAQNYFDHTSPSGCTAVCRYQNAGYSYWSMGENIYWMEGYTLSTTAAAQQIVASWQNSAGHRANDLGDFTRIGVGIVQSGTKYEVTADFATPR